MDEYRRDNKSNFFNNNASFPARKESYSFQLDDTLPLSLSLSVSLFRYYLSPFSLSLSLFRHYALLSSSLVGAFLFDLHPIARLRRRRRWRCSTALPLSFVFRVFPRRRWPLLFVFLPLTPLFRRTIVSRARKLVDGAQAMPLPNVRV